jgi:hypothetical protein
LSKGRAKDVRHPGPPAAPGTIAIASVYDYGPGRNIVRTKPS